MSVSYSVNLAGHFKKVQPKKNSHGIERGQFQDKGKNGEPLDERGLF